MPSGNVRRSLVWATSIDVLVEIGQDTVVEPFSSLKGRTSIGSESVIGSGSTLIAAERIGRRARLVPFVGS